MKKTGNSTRWPVSVATVIVGALSSAAALGHVTLDRKTADAGLPLEMSFRVGHGCSGSDTVRVRIRIPEGIVAVEPVAKAGWEAKTETGPYDEAHIYEGRSFKDGAKEVIWTGLLSAHKTESFAIKAGVSTSVKSGKMFFPVVQECEKGVERWIDEDETGEHPAPLLIIAAKH